MENKRWKYQFCIQMYHMMASEVNIWSNQRSKKQSNQRILDLRLISNLSKENPTTLYIEYYVLFIIKLKSEFLQQTNSVCSTL